MTQHFKFHTISTSCAILPPLTQTWYVFVIVNSHVAWNLMMIRSHTTTTVMKWDCSPFVIMREYQMGFHRSRNGLGIYPGSKLLSQGRVYYLYGTILLEEVVRRPVSQWIRSPRKSDPGRIRYASDFDPTSADSIQSINGDVGFHCQLFNVNYGVFMQT